MSTPNDVNGQEVGFSIVVLGLVINITLLVKIKYGDALITHLTCITYYVSLALLIVMLVDHVGYLMLATHDSRHPDGEEPLKFWLYCISTTAITKYALLVLLILLRAFQNEALLVFIFFQKNFRLERLDVAKDSYRKLEKRMAWGFVIQYSVLMSPMLVQIVGQFTAFYKQITVYNTVYFACLLVLAIAAYTSSTISLIINMRRSHRTAFNSHIRSIAVLTLATLLSVFAQLGLQFYIIRFWACEVVGGEAMNGLP